ncbi:hypothetical protein [Cardiobacterium valvarum]|uniref:Uncharacterized protein n=1 Tax=Cardiobacterium valvarum F0432 TaxID=797473 RepID=G9ZHN6_9GAMM|nr:hypothetical protein [Cardiobacterium valvarum]EHM52485.1 hypothetical protein HMPREF9080_02294 [Cardiobacterium valvarum F0432]
MRKTLMALTLIAPQAGAAPLFSDDIAVGKQLLTYLGKDSKAATALVLTRKPDGGDAVARIKADSPVTILLVDDKGRVLVKNAFGLTGWVQADTSGAAADKLDGLQKAAIGEGEFIFYHDPKNSTFLNESLPGKDEEPETYRALRGKLAGDDKDYFVYCDQGMSGDPNCTIFPVPADGKAPTETAYDENRTLNGETYYLPGDGTVYTDTRANLYYQTRSKYTLKGDKLDEVIQPYHYIGVDSKAENTFTLDGLDGKKHKVKKGEKVRVILDDPHAIPCKEDEICKLKLLVQNAAGDTGWVIPDTYSGEEDKPGPKIEYIRFYGD